MLSQQTQHGRRTTRRRTWDRFSESCLVGNHLSAADSPLLMPVSEIYFECLLDASIRHDIQRRQFEAVMARDSSSDLAICASNTARNQASLELHTAWREFQTYGKATS